MSGTGCAPSSTTRRRRSGLLTASIGVFASVPLVARVLFPQTTSRLREAVASVVAPPLVTRLRLERLTEQPGLEGDAIGYSLEEMAGIGERILSETGLRSGSFPVKTSISGFPTGLP